MFPLFLSQVLLEALYTEGDVYRDQNGNPQRTLSGAVNRHTYHIGMFITNFSLYSVYVQCKSFAKLTWPYVPYRTAPLTTDKTQGDEL